MNAADIAALDIVRRAAHWFEPGPAGLGPLVEAFGDARMVLIGEASHGTHEFYRTRADLTQRLIEEKGFNIVAVEADWPDAYRAGQWVRHESHDPDAESALGSFTRFPRWMWRNREVVRFLNWLRQYNELLAPASRVGFFGLDLYSLHTSIEAVLGYLQKVDPTAATRARYRYSCLGQFGEDPQDYGYAASFGLTRHCEDEVVQELVELRRRAAEYATRDGRVAAENYFAAEQNARLIANAEAYYRAMFGGRVESWNVRDMHMMETLEALTSHVERTTGRARAIVWAHNSHLGDARATQMSTWGELNLGQLVREKFEDEAALIGFTTHTGSVTAASNWGEPAQRMTVRPSIQDSYERLFHHTDIPRFVLLMNDDDVRAALVPQRLERAIGVVYRPDSERLSHYFTTTLSQQFDAVIHFDESSALQPLEPWSRDEVDLPETYPTGI